MVGDVSVDSFLDLLSQSDLVSDAQLLALSAEFLGENLRPDSPQKLADELVKREILTTWQSEMLLQGKHRGFRLGPYRILCPLGQGGMSKVFLAEHEMMRRRSAIKILPSKYQEDKDLLNRFHLEARAVAALDHPNIVRAYDFNKDVRYGKEIHYLVMEYVEGFDLRRMIEEQEPLDCRKAADFICQAALGLAHAHAAGFVHRDIKPANLLVDPHGVLKILDLGLATFTFEAEQTLNPDEGVQSAVGTADYVSPEQVVDSRNVDGRADIYSLGLTFYFLLTGHRPFSKPTIMEVLMAHRSEKPEPIGKFRPDVPMDLEGIIDKMSAKSPQHRYQTAKEVAEKLQKWQSESGSGRTYSRLSALMAEAARMKQPTANDTSPAAASPTGNTELELKLVEDESTFSLDAPTSELTEEEKPTATETTPEKHRDVANSGALPVAKKLEDDSAKSGPMKKGVVGGKTPSGEKTASAEPRAKDTDLLAGLFEEEMASGLPMAESLSGLTDGQGPLQPVPFSQSRKSSGLSQVLQSPWAWIGLAGGCAIVLIVIMVLAFGSSSNAPDSPSEKETTAPASDSQSLPPPAPVPIEQSASPESVVVSPEAPPSPPVAPLPPQPPVKSDKETLLATEIEKPVPSPEVVQEKAPPATKQEIKPVIPAPSPPRETPPTPPDAINPNVLLAEMETISVQLSQPLGPNPRRGFNRAVVNQAKYAATRVKIKNVENSKNVMDIAVTEEHDDKVYHIMLNAELKCPDPKGNPVSVWKKSQPIRSVELNKMDKIAVLRVLNGEMGKDAARKFFQQFDADVKLAQEKAGVK